MLSASLPELLLAAAALLCWPSRARCLGGPQRAALGAARSRQSVSSSRLTVVVIAGVTLTIAVSVGPLVGLAAALVIGTVALLVRAELARAHERRDLIEILDATRTLARELRSGTAPVAAITACAAAHRGRSADVLRALAVDVAGDRGGAVQSANVGLTAEITGRLARGWRLSARYGVPWAALVDAVSLDLADRVRAKAQRSAQVSGPRVSGYVLALMPCLGVLLGIGMGADPLHILFGTGAGQLMLVIGCLLTCAGLAWTARIVRG